MTKEELISDIINNYSEMLEMTDFNKHLTTPLSNQNFVATTPEIISKICLETIRKISSIEIIKDEKRYSITDFLLLVYNDINKSDSEEHYFIDINKIMNAGHNNIIAEIDQFMYKLNQLSVQYPEFDKNKREVATLCMKLKANLKYTKITNVDIICNNNRFSIKKLLMKTANINESCVKYFKSIEKCIDSLPDFAKNYLEVNNFYENDDTLFYNKAHNEIYIEDIKDSNECIIITQIITTDTKYNSINKTVLLRLISCIILNIICYFNNFNNEKYINLGGEVDIIYMTIYAYYAYKIILKINNNNIEYLNKFKNDTFETELKNLNTKEDLDYYKILDKSVDELLKMEVEI